ncbi:MAG: glycosyltransferase [Candidatus Thermoplasmatota archaeon]|jgi:dolichol-phosphate mannosyltransferase|nr:glycosyltransferase [Candidatus Thermoplasmatota archaeon]MCL5794686.1 glycosyltransferase [Candidatus Thermoplasmatota archaeon]
MGNGFSIILAVINEESNIPPLIARIDSLVANGKLTDLKDIIFCDGGSTDRTLEVIDALIREGKPYSVGIEHQKIRPGTAPATLEALHLATGNDIVVMDGDLQHPPEVLVDLIAEKSKGFDLVVASRNTQGGKVERTMARAIISRGAEFLARRAVVQAREVRDPISGYFIVGRKYLENLKPMGGLYKLLLYVMAANPALRISEIPFSFGMRVHGVSKLTQRSTHFLRRYIRELNLYRQIQKEATSHSRVT